MIIDYADDHHNHYRNNDDDDDDHDDDHHLGVCWAWMTQDWVRRCWSNKQEACHKNHTRHQNHNQAWTQLFKNHFFHLQPTAL